MRKCRGASVAQSRRAGPGTGCDPSPVIGACSNDSERPGFETEFSFCDFCRSFVIPPPQHGKRRQAVARHSIGAPEPIPAGRTQRAEIPMRHNVVVPKQNAIERFGCGRKLVPASGKDDCNRCPLCSVLPRLRCSRKVGLSASLTGRAPRLAGPASNIPMELSLTSCVVKPPNLGERYG
jgi:hypothetical protein